MTFRVALFDIDGTLVDSNDQHARAWVEAFREHGHVIDFDRVRCLIGKGGDKIIPELIGEDAESDVGKAISETRTNIFKERYLPHLRAFEGSRDLALRLKARGLRIGVASSAKKEEIGALLRIARIDDLVEKTASGDDAEASKPDPDIVRAALERMKARAEEAVLIGDTPYDLEAAAHAHVAAVAVTSGGWKEQALTPALAVYRDVQELHLRFDDSPFAR